jgi:hypothetical protein
LHDLGARDAHRDQLGQQLTPAGGDQQHERQVAHPLGHVRQVAQRRHVTPLDVVRHQHGGVAAGELGGQPVEAVQGSHVRAWLRLSAGAASAAEPSSNCRRSGRSRAFTPANSCRTRFQLTCSSCPARAQHQQAGVGGVGRERPGQAGLPDARGALDHNDRSLALLRQLDQFG